MLRPRWAAALLLLPALCGAAGAQTTAASLDCVPKTVLTPMGSGSQLRQGVSAGGTWWGTWCPGAPAPYVHIVLNGYEWTSVRITSTVAALLSEPDPLAGIRLAMAVNAIAPQPADLTTWAAIKADAVAAMAADKPASPVYVVGPATRADGTRPAYRYVDGVRASLSEATGAQAGQPCDAAKKLQATTAGIWAPFGPAFAPEIGTLCVPKN